MNIGRVKVSAVTFVSPFLLVLSNRVAAIVFSKLTVNSNDDDENMYKDVCLKTLTSHRI